MKRTIVNGHSLDLMQGMTSNSIACAVFSPPYPWGRKYDIPHQVWGGDAKCDHEWIERRFYHEGGAGNAGDRFIQAGAANAQLRKETRWQTEHNCHCGAWRGEFGREEATPQYIDHLRMICVEALRVLEPTGSIWLNIGDTYHKKAAQAAPELAYTMLAEIGFSLRSHIIWDKGRSAGGVQRDRPDPTVESILFAVKARNRQKYYYNKESKYARDRIWRIRGAGRKGHNAGYPIELPRRCIELGCRPDGLVLDPFAGSGATLEAAEVTQRESIGFELNPEYCPDAVVNSA
jgi:DNA modification methylase